MLYIVSTPIGNLQDITLRALDILKQVDYILAEDTRKSQILLSHFGITKRMESFHSFSEAKKEEQIIEDLKNGKNIALISDAGTPLIADPGSRLVERVIREGIECTTAPGASAILAALCLSGFEPIPFQFVGFIPKKESEREALFEEILGYRGTTILYESPERIQMSVFLLSTLDPGRPLVIARELTKKFETILRGSAKELASDLEKNPPRGEIVLLIDRRREDVKIDEEALICKVKKLHKSGLSLKEAIDLVSKEAKISKRLLYNRIVSQFDT
jgi:16S rRNA (cytidine1402-2'-O)-methyltransferase